MATLKSIKSKVWGISLLGTGAVAEGLASLRQCISIILHTTLGTDPLRPLFGSRVYKYQDAPVNIAIPNIKASIIEALSIWEKRIKVQSVTHRYANAGHIEFEVTYLLVDENLVDSIIFNPDITIGGVTNFLLQCIFPPGHTTSRNYISFTLNNNNVLPPPPFGGFANTTDTYNWCRTNWSNFGVWTLLSDRILLRLNPGNYSQAALVMSLLRTEVPVEVRFAARIPVVDNYDPSFNIKFNPDGTGLLQSNPIITPVVLMTKDDLTAFANNYWSAFGRWVIEPYNNNAASFSDDFSDDFEVLVDGYELVLYSRNVLTATLEVELI